MIAMNLLFTILLLFNFVFNHLFLRLLIKDLGYPFEFIVLEPFTLKQLFLNLSNLGLIKVELILTNFLSTSHLFYLIMLFYS